MKAAIGRREVLAKKMGKIKVQKTKSSQLKEILIDKIINGGYQTGSKLPSEVDLMRQYEVSNTTLYKALTELVHEGYIFREKGKGTFVADYRRANKLKGKRIIGCLGMPAVVFAGYVFNELCMGIQDAIRENGYEMIFRMSHNNVEEEVQQLEQLIDIVDGLIMVPSSMANTSDLTMAALLKFQERQIPFVLIDHYIKRLNCNYVVTDNFAGMYAAVAHLAKLGYKSITLLACDDWNCLTSAVDRKRGYEQAIKDFNIGGSLRNEAETIIFLPRDLYSNSVYERVVERILKVSDKPAAVAATEYHLAIGVIEAALRMGLKVPEELSVTGFDKYQIPGHSPSIKMTTVIQPMYDIGRKAINILTDNIENGVKAAEKVAFPSQLVIGESCGAGLVASQP
jgi:GntR family transcriptional regulator of arabinose operon